MASRLSELQRRHAEGKRAVAMFAGRIRRVRQLRRDDENIPWLESQKARHARDLNAVAREIAEIRARQAKARALVTKAQPSSQTRFSDLPPDVLRIVAGRMSPQNKARLAQTSRAAANALKLELAKLKRESQGGQQLQNFLTQAWLEAYEVARTGRLGADWVQHNDGTAIWRQDFRIANDRDWYTLSAKAEYDGGHYIWLLRVNDHARSDTDRVAMIAVRSGAKRFERYGGMSRAMGTLLDASARRAFPGVRIKVGGAWPPLGRMG